jgi:hypothetical protein
MSVVYCCRPRGWAATVYGGPDGREPLTVTTKTQGAVLAWRDERLAEGWLAEPRLRDELTGPAFGTCSYPTEHGEHHKPHPLTGRLTCHRCHPPVGAER